jgi:hypothetical protein
MPMILRKQIFLNLIFIIRIFVFPSKESSIFEENIIRNTSPSFGEEFVHKIAKRQRTILRMVE